MLIDGAFFVLNGGCVADEKQSLIEWFKELYPHQQIFVAANAMSVLVGVLIAILIYHALPENFPLEPMPLLVLGLVALYLNNRDWKDKW